MKYEIILYGNIKKSLNTSKKRGQDIYNKKRGLDISLLESVVDTLLLGLPLEKKYKDHALKGKLAGFRECPIQPDWL